MEGQARPTPSNGRRRWRLLPRTSTMAAATLLLCTTTATHPSGVAYLSGSPLAWSGGSRSSRRPARTAVRMTMNPDVGPQGGEEPEGTRVEEALRVTTRQIKALQRLVDSFSEVPAPDEAPQFPPVDVQLPVPTRATVDGDRAEILRLNQRYYRGLNDRDVKGILELWREDGTVQMYANEDKIITGKGEIDKHFDSRFRNAWATNKHKARMDVVVEDERVFLRGINAFVTNKEVWENPKTKERKVMFATKVFTKSNGEWNLVHVHAGDGSQIEVNPNGQMKLTDGGARSFGQQQQPTQQLPGGAAGQSGQQAQLGAALGGLLGQGQGMQPGETGFTADGREYRTIVTPEGYRIILGSNGAGGIQGSIGGGPAGQSPRSGQETKEALLKALIQDLSKNGKTDIIPLQLGARGGRGGGSGGQELFSGSLDGARGRRSGGGGGDAGGENLTKKTVAAIRQLCLDGRLTVPQKQKLIFSVIRSTKAEEISQVEMAYDLLVENAVAGDDSGLEEFLDQCILLSSSLFASDSDDESDGFESD